MTNTTLGYCTALPGGAGNAALSKAFAPVHSGLLPAPLALFPLTPQLLTSITLPPYSPRLSYGLGAAPSFVFDNVITCSEVMLDAATCGTAHQASCFEFVECWLVVPYQCAWHSAAIELGAMALIGCMCMSQEQQSCMTLPTWTVLGRPSGKCCLPCLSAALFMEKPLKHISICQKKQRHGSHEQL